MLLLDPVLWICAAAVLFFWPVWWMCWDIVVAAAKALLGLEEDQP